MRILHLIDSQSPQACHTTLAMLADQQDRLGEIEQRVLLLGGTPLKRAALAVGLKDVQIVGVPHGRAILGYASVLPKIRAMGSFDIVHCWSIGALTLASLIWGLRKEKKSVRLVLTLTQMPDEKNVRWLRVLLSEALGARTTILPISSTIARTLLSGGLPEANVHVLRPGLDQSRLARSSRDEIRKAWKLPGEHTKVVALLSDPAPATDAILGMWVPGLIAQSRDGDHESLRIVLHPKQKNFMRALQITRGTGRTELLVEDSMIEQPWNILPACDFAIALGPHAGGLTALWAMAASIPVVAEATYAVSEILEDRHSALLAKPNQPQALAQRLEMLLTDHRLAWQLRDTASHEAYSFFSRARYCQSIQIVYEQLHAGAPVEVPPLPSTGGLRFTGRA